MIKITDSAKLALTKLRTRKIRLFITVFIAGILFSGLFAASMIVRGVFKSVDNFSNEGFGKRYIVAAHSNFQDKININKEIIARAEQLNSEVVAKKKIEAKRLGIQYDAANDTKPVSVSVEAGGKVKTLVSEHPIAMQVIEEYYQKNPQPGIGELKEIASKYGATKYYQSKMPSLSGSPPQLKILKDNKEDFEEKESSEQMSFNGQGVDSFSAGWWLMDDNLLSPFILPDLTAPEGKIPLVAPLPAIEQMLGLKALPADAKASEKLERVKYVRENLQKAELKICYRNSASSERISSAISTAQDIDQNKDNKEYQKPALIYGLPDEPCGPAKIAQDTRTAEQKNQDVKQEEFNKMFGKQSPEQRVLSLKIVGISPGLSNGSMNQFSSVVATLVGSSLDGLGWYTPLKFQEQNDIVKSYFANTSGDAVSTTYYAEFPSSDSANMFLNEQNCQPSPEAFSHSDSQGTDPFAECNTEGKYFTLIPFGSNNLALEGAQRGFSQFINYFGIGLLIIATIILFFTIGRTIADSRRETAVFRAIGAKRMDISLIYIIYAFFITLLIIAFSFGLGLALTKYIDSKYSEDITTNMLVIYSARDISRKFVLLSIYVPELLRVMGTIIMAGMISVILNLFRNVRRNPIHDMRDDT